MRHSIDSAPVVIGVSERAGIWRVTLDAIFYGDYVKKAWAMEAALEKARELRASGANTRVEMTDAVNKRTSLVDDASAAPSS